MINLVKLYTEYFPYFRTILYHIQDIINPNWHEELLSDKKYLDNPGITELAAYPECIIVNLDPMLSVDQVLYRLNQHQGQINEVVLLQFDLVTFTLVKDNFAFIKSGVLFIFNIELLQKLNIHKKTIASKMWNAEIHHMNVLIDNIDFIKEHVQLNIVLMAEASGVKDLRFLLSIDTSNTFFIGQKVFFENAISFEYQHWLIETVWVNLSNWILHRQLGMLQPYSKKNLYFDCLLGKYKEARASLLDKIIENNLTKYTWTATHEWPNFPNSLTISKKFEPVILSQCPGIEFKQDPKYKNRVIVNKLESTVNKFKLGNVSLTFSQLLDLEIYNETAYSIVVETHTDTDDWNEWIKTYFVTEKTCKPILAKRLFLIYGPPGYLNYLQTLGFRTFGNIIDESYDQIKDTQKRETLIIEQMKKLVNLEQELVFEQIKPIVEHNYNTLVNLYFDKNMMYFLEHFH